MALNEITLHCNLVGNELQFSCYILMNSAYLPISIYTSNIYLYFGRLSLTDLADLID